MGSVWEWVTDYQRAAPVTAWGCRDGQQGGVNMQQPTSSPPIDFSRERSCPKRPPMLNRPCRP